MIEKTKADGTVVLEQEYKAPTNTAPAESRARLNATMPVRTTEAPLAIAPTMPPVSAPRVTPTPYGVVVSHREYVGDLDGHYYYHTDDYDVNPGNPDMFPWLSRMAPRYEQYHFRRLQVAILPSTAATGDGMKGCMLDYDVNDPPPTTKSELLNSFGAQRANSWAPLHMRVPAVALNQVHWRNVGKGFQINDENSTRYITAALEGNQLVDQRLDSIGKLNIITVGYGSALDTVKQAAMELWVEYEIEFRINQSGTDNIRSANIRADIADNPTLSPSTPFGTTDFGWSVVPGGLSIYNGYTELQRLGIAPQGQYTYLGFSAPGHYIVYIKMNGGVINNVIPAIPASSLSVGNLHVTAELLDGTYAATPNSTNLLYRVVVGDVNSLFVIDWTGASTSGGIKVNIWAAEIAPGSVGPAA